MFNSKETIQTTQFTIRNGNHRAGGDNWTKQQQKKYKCTRKFAQVHEGTKWPWDKSTFLSKPQDDQLPPAVTAVTV